MLHRSSPSESGTEAMSGDRLEALGALATERILEAYSSTGGKAPVPGRNEVLKLLGGGTGHSR